MHFSNTKWADQVIQISQKKTTPDDGAQPRCSGWIQPRKKKNNESSDVNDEKKIKINDDAEASCSHKSRKIDSDESDWSDNDIEKSKKVDDKFDHSLYSKAFDGEQGYCLDKFCDKLIKKFETKVKLFEDDYDFRTFRVRVEKFLHDLEDKIHWKWLPENHTLTRTKTEGMKRIINQEIIPSRSSVNFIDFIKYIRRSADIRFQLEWDKWEIEYISHFIIDVFSATSQVPDAFSSETTSSSDEGFEN